MTVVLVDQDGVLANFEQGLLDVLRARHPGAPFIALADRRVFYAREQYPPEWAGAIDAIVRSEGFYRDLPAIEGAPTALQEMREAGHNVFLCTSPMASSRWCVQEKLAWVEQHLGRPGCAARSSPRTKPWLETGSSRAFWSTTGLRSRVR